MNSDAVNVAIAKLCGWTDIRQGQYSDSEWDMFGIPPGAEDEQPIPDYRHDLNAALAAALEKLPNGLCIYLDRDDPHIVYATDKSDQFGMLWERLEAKSSQPADIAAAVCEAILQANGVALAEQGAEEAK